METNENAPELHELQSRTAALEAREAQFVDLIRTLATQLNRNTLVMQRWLEGSGELQAIARAHAEAAQIATSALILPSRHDASVIPVNRLRRR